MRREPKNQLETDLLTIIRGTVELVAVARNCPDDWPFVCTEDFVLQNGFFFDRADHSQLFRSGQSRACYQNAGKIAARRNDFQYVEGYALGVFPVLHAWLTDDGQTCYDRTPGWKLESETAYFGCVFSKSYIAERKRARGYYCIFDDAYSLGWPLLSGKHSVETALHFRP